MGGWTVLFTATASEHVKAIRDWWVANRVTAPTLFIDELLGAEERLSQFPGTESPFGSASVAGLRRVILPRCRYHVYYTVHPIRREVIVRAVWHAARGEGPQLPALG